MGYDNIVAHPGETTYPLTTESAVRTLTVVGILVAAVLFLGAFAIGLGAVEAPEGAQSLATQADERTPNSPCQGQEELLAKYNWEQSGDKYQFVSDQGDDVVTFDVGAVDDGNPAEGPVEVDWTAEEPVDVVVVRAGGGRDPEQVIQLDSATEGTVTTERGISFLAFCVIPSTPTPTPTPTETPQGETVY